MADDEETVREVAAAALRHSGFEVLLAADGQAAVELFGSHAGEISAVLLDLTMPRMGGDEALREMRRIRPDLPVLLSSGYSEQEALSRIEGGALVAFIQKPYRPAQLIEAVCALLAEG